MTELPKERSIIFDSASSIFISSGYGTGCALLKFNGSELEEVWKNKNLASHFSTPVWIDGFIYGVDGNAGGGSLVCLDVKSGAQKWKGKTGFGSFVVSNEKIIYIAEGGDLIVADASPVGYKEIARAKTGLQAKCWTMPVLSNGKLYCRNDRGSLVCFDLQ